MPPHLHIHFQRSPSLLSDISRDSANECTCLTCPLVPADDDTLELEGLSAAFGQMQGDLDRQRLLGEQRAVLDPVAEVRARQIEHQERSVPLSLPSPQSSLAGGANS